MQVEIRVFNFRSNVLNEWPCNLLVKEIRFGIRKASVFKIVELVNEIFILCKESVEVGSIKDEPLVNVSCNKVFYLQVFVCDPFAQVIQNQFLKSLYIQFSRCLLRRIAFGKWPEHFRFVCRLFGFNDNDYRAFGRIGVMDDEIIASFGIDKKFRIVIRFLQKINDEVFVKLFAFGIIAPVKQRDEMRFESLNFSAVWLHLQKGFVERLHRFQFM